MIITPAIQPRECEERPSLLEDREIMTAMRYNFDIKNSLFDYQKRFSSYAKYIPTVHCCHTAFKRLYTPSDKENLIWNKSRNTFFIADNSNAHALPLAYIFIPQQWMCLEITEKKTTRISWRYSEAWCW